MREFLNNIYELFFKKQKLLLLAISLISFSLGFADDFVMADRVIVEKSKRQLHLMKNGKSFKTYKIALGGEPKGDKFVEGDQKTPEGNYVLDSRNPNSEYFLSIRISYPNHVDLKEAALLNASPGGQIMIHGQPNIPIFSKEHYETKDWTNGCIAVSNSDMIDIWLMTSEMVPIEILP